MLQNLLKIKSTVFPRIVFHVTLNETKRIWKIHFSKKIRASVTGLLVPIRVTHVMYNVGDIVSNVSSDEEDDLPDI